MTSLWGDAQCVELAFPWPGMKIGIRFGVVYLLNSSFNAYPATPGLSPVEEQRGGGVACQFSSLPTLAVREKSKSPGIEATQENDAPLMAYRLSSPWPGSWRLVLAIDSAPLDPAIAETGSRDQNLLRTRKAHGGHSLCEGRRVT